MDHRVKTSKDLALNLAHAKAVISACSVAPPRIEISDGDDVFIRLRIMRMISELETIDKFDSKTAMTVKQGRTNAKGKTGRDLAFASVHTGMYAETDHTASDASPATGSEPCDDITVRKPA